MVPFAWTNYEAEYLPSHKVNEARMCVEKIIAIWRFSVMFGDFLSCLEIFSRFFGDFQ